MPITEIILDPAREEAGITIEGKDKWLTLMKKSIQYQKAKTSTSTL